MRSPLLVAPLLVGCGRLLFSQAGPSDAAADAAADAVVNGGFGAGCVVGLRMDEAAWTGAPGEVIDSCGGDNAGAARQGAQPVDDGARGRTGEFPLPSGCVEIAESPSLHATTGLTLSAWIYPESLDAVNPYAVIAKRTDFANDDAEYTLFVWTDNTVWVDIDSRNDRNHGSRQILNGQWQQLTLVYDGTLPVAQRVRIYVDGALDAELAETSASLNPKPSGLTIGCMRDQPIETAPQIALGGRIDDVGVWTRAFSAQEVKAWYRSTMH